MRLVMFSERVLRRQPTRPKRLVGLGVLVACYECLNAPLYSRQSAEYSLIINNDASP